MPNCWTITLAARLAGHDNGPPLALRALAVAVSGIRPRGDTHLCAGGDGGVGLDIEDDVGEVMDKTPQQQIWFDGQLEKARDEGIENPCVRWFGPDIAGRRRFCP